jgi:hypothetical protein
MRINSYLCYDVYDTNYTIEIENYSTAQKIFQYKEKKKLITEFTSRFAPACFITPSWTLMYIFSNAHLCFSETFRYISNFWHACYMRHCIISYLQTLRMREKYKLRSSHEILVCHGSHYEDFCFLAWDAV